MSFTVIDLNQLPPPDVVEELNIDTIFQEQLEDLRSYNAELADNIRVGDPAYDVLLVSSTRELKLRQRINEGALAVMLAYSEKNDLDNMGAYWDVERLTIDPGDPDAIPPRDPIYEDDDTYRYRIQLSTEGQTNAGTEGSYLFQTLKSDQRVKSASAKSHAAGNVVITVLSREGDGTVSSELLTSVTDYLNQPTVRQMTDNLTVQGATIIDYRITATLYIYDVPGADQVMETARQAVTEYVIAMQRIGILVPISGIYGALQQPGIVRVDLTSPTGDIEVTDEQASYCTAIELTQVVAT